MRQQFALPERDVACLEALGYRWEALVEGPYRWLLLHDFPVPDGYTSETATVALMIHGAYPDAQIDMAYIFPALARKDGRLISALTQQQIEGRNYQRWSRHRTAENPWRAGEDDICTHLALVEDWLRREFEKVPAR